LVWKNAPIQLEFHITAHRIEVLRDGKLLESAEWDEKYAARIDDVTVGEGAGVCGKFGGKITQVAPPE